MRRVGGVVEHSRGALEIVPFGALWEVAGVIADVFPLDRESEVPRPLRRAGHWVRLVLVDRALTNPEHSAVVTLSEPSWMATAVVCGSAALLAPRLPVWFRRSLLVALVIWAARGNRLRRFLALRRELRTVAPDALLVGDYVARQSGTAVPWLAEVLDAIGRETAFVVLLPGSADDRRNRARERLYTTRFGLRVVARTSVSGEGVTILLRDRAPAEAGDGTESVVGANTA